VIEEKAQLHEMGVADALVLSTCVSEIAPTVKQYRAIQRSNDTRPVFVGSGFNLSTLSRLYGLFSGALVDSGVQIDGRFDAEMCRRVVAAVNSRGKLAV
jgi:predicted TIM-barrel enzyme